MATVVFPVPPPYRSQLRFGGNNRCVLFSKKTCLFIVDTLGAFSRSLLDAEFINALLDVVKLIVEVVRLLLEKFNLALFCRSGSLKSIVERSPTPAWSGR